MRWEGELDPTVLRANLEVPRDTLDVLDEEVDVSDHVARSVTLPPAWNARADRTVVQSRQRSKVRPESPTADSSASSRLRCSRTN